MHRILLIEDDAHLAEGLRYNLERAGYDVLHADSGRAGLRLARAEEPDLIVLDLMLPGMHGFDLLAKLRAGGAAMPVIILSAQGDEVDKIRGMDAGADDFVSKPFGVGELLARIRARLRGPTGQDLAFAGAVVRLDRLVCERNGEEIPLTPTEVELLRLLGRNSGKPVSREELLREIWGVDGAVSRTLDTHVNRLRKKLEPDPAHPRFLLTVHGVGYRLAVE